MIPYIISYSFNQFFTLFLWFENIFITYYLYMTKFNRKNKKSKTKKRKITKSKKLKGGGTSKKSSSRRNFGKPTFPGLPLQLSLGKAAEGAKVIKKEKDLMEEYESYIKNKAIPQKIKENKEKGEYLYPLHKNSSRHMYDITKSQEPGTPETVSNLWYNEDLYADAAEAGVTVFDSPSKIYSPITGISNSPLKPETSPWKKIPQLNINNNRRNNKHSK